jgi:HEAT repeat protein
MMTGMSLTDRPVAELVREALSADVAGDEDRRWDIVCHLHRYGGERALSIARQLCQSQHATHRVLGADILAQLGATVDRPASQSPFREAAAAILLEIVNREEDAGVLVAISVGFGHLNDARCIQPLARLHTHPDPDVRHAVAVGLLGSPERAALDILIELSADPDPHVGDWATFGLARQTDADFEELRGALVARTSDPDLDTRAEALHGLSTRGDSRATQPLLDVLDAPWPGSDSYVVDEALYALAAATGDPRLCMHVAAHRARWLSGVPDETLPRREG